MQHYIIELERKIESLIFEIKFCLDFNSSIDLYVQDLRDIMQSYHTEIQYREDPILNKKYEEYVKKIKIMVPKYSYMFGEKRNTDTNSYNFFAKFKCF